MKSIFPKCSFTLGELSPRNFGRFDQEKPIYRDAVAIMENFLIFQSGGTFYRPGTEYIATAGQVAPVRLDTFQYSLLQEYILEFGNQYLQFYANSGQVVTAPNTPLKITTPYLQADLFNLQLANKQDVMYIVNPNYTIYKLIRTSATSFVIQKVQLIGGPFRDTNVGNVTITPSAATGSTTLTATIPAWSTGVQYLPGDYVTNSGTTYLCLLSHTSGTFATDLAAGDWIAQNFFQPGHVGSLWGIGTSTLSDGGVVVITSYSSGTSISGYVQNTAAGAAGNLGTTSATTVWAEGLFSTFRGNPVAVCFHEGRLCLSTGSTIAASVVGSYEDFSPGTATDSDAWNYTTTVGDTIQWMASVIVNGAIGLRTGTLGGIVNWLDGGQSGITPSAPPTITPGPDYQVQYMVPRKISSYVYYMQGNSFQLRQLIYDFTIAADKSEDMTLLADHILRDGGGVIQIARQESPNDRIWLIRDDGQIAVLTRNVEQQILGWNRLIAGTSSGGPGTFNSIAIIPIQGNDDQVWVSVSRMINGVETQFIEMFTPELFQHYWEPNRLDCSLHLDIPITISGVTNANPVVITATAHGLSNGNRVKIDSIKGMATTVINSLGQVIPSSLNGNQYLVANVTTNTFTLTDLYGSAINTTSWSFYQSGGQVRLMNTTFSGLGYLNGETVSVVTDGGLPAAQQTYLVSGGEIILPNPAAVVSVGLPYQGTMQLLPLSEYVQGEPTQSMKRKVYNPIFKFWRSAGGQFGYPMSNLYPIMYPNENPNNIPDMSLGLYTGDLELDMESFFDPGWSPFVIQNVPLPLMILSAIFRSDIQADK